MGTERGRVSDQPTATFASGWLAPNLGARQARVRIRVPAGTSLARFTKNPIVLYGHNTECAVGTALDLDIDDTGDLAATVDFAGANTTAAGEQAWRSVAATLTRLGEIVIQDGEVVEMRLVPIARGAWPADDAANDDAPAGAERARRTKCTANAPCGESGCALCEGVGRTDGDDDFCDCSTTPCECVRFDALRENTMNRKEMIREIRSNKDHADFDARGKSDDYVRAYADVVRARRPSADEPDPEDENDEDSPPSRPPRRGATSVRTDAVEDPEGHARRQMQLRNIQAGRRPLSDASPVVARTDAVRDDRADFDRGIDIEARARTEARERAIRRSRGQGGGPEAA